MEKLHNIVYKTTCLINNKIYIGVHCTNKLNDGYIGNGIYNQRTAEKGKSTQLFHNAVKKYGYDNFKREILHDFIAAEHAFGLEKVIVDEYFVSREDNYNMKIGGNGGNTMTGKHHKPETLKKMSISQSGENNPQFGKDPWNKGKKGEYSEEYRRKIGIKSKGRIPGNARKVLNTKTGIVYSSSTQASKETGISKSHITTKCKRNNNDSEWKYKKD